MAVFGCGMRHLSLVQRIFLLFRTQARPLDRRDVKTLLNLGDAGLKHAMARLVADACVRPVPGRYGFFEFVPGATMPVDTRGTSAASRGNLKRGRVGVGVSS